MTTWQHYKAGDKREGGTPMPRHRKQFAAISDQALFLEHQEAMARWGLEMQGVPKRPDPSKLLASVHPKVVKRRRAPVSDDEPTATGPVVTILEDYVAPSSEEIEAQGGTVGHRIKVREWWERAFAGAERINVPDLAEQAVAHFAQDEAFVARFWDEYAYQIMYEEGIDLLSSSRIAFSPPGPGSRGAIERPVEWFERADHGHVALSAATDAEWEFALRQREDEVAAAQARVQMLRDIRAGRKVVGLAGVPLRYGMRYRRGGEEEVATAPATITLVRETAPLAMPEFSDEEYHDDGFASDRYQATKYGPTADPEGKGRFWEDYGVTLGGGPELLLRCPVCSENYNHHDSPIEYRRAKEDGPTVATCRGEPVTPRHPNPSSRRNGLAIPMWCEQGHHWTLFISQHKGLTFVHATASPPPAGVGDGS